MSEDTAIRLAIESIEARIQTLAIDADLCDIWSLPQPTELIAENFRTPRRIAASEKRKQLRLAIATLRQMRPSQRAMDLETA
jgi:hypothetical protein